MLFVSLSPQPPRNMNCSRLKYMQSSSRIVGGKALPKNDKGDFRGTPCHQRPQLLSRRDFVERCDTDKQFSLLWVSTKLIIQQGAKQPWAVFLMKYAEALTT